MKFAGLTILMLTSVLAGGPPTRAAEPLTRAQERAAIEDAVQGLLSDVSRMSLSRDLTVGDFLRRTRSTDEVVKTLQRAQQLGGIRWIDEQTCQVELQISGPVVGAALVRAAAANPRTTPLPVREMERVARDWEGRTFSATGTATSRQPAARRPAGAGANAGGPGRLGFAPEGGNAGGRPLPRRDPWDAVPAASRDQAVAAAKQDAARRVVHSVRAIPVTARTTVGDVLSVRGVGEAMQEWVVSQRATRVDFRDDLEAEVELDVTPAAALAAFRDLAARQRDVAVPTDDAGWELVRKDFERKLAAAPVGRGVPPAEGGGGGPAIGNQVIGRPRDGLVGAAGRPLWADRRLSERGTAGPARGRSKLAAARVAQAAAEDKLRAQIEALVLDGQRTLGDAAKQDPRVEQAIRRALAASRIGRADYKDDGGADVDVFLDLDTLWAEVRGLQ
jgi:hypothetical protein